MRLYSKGQLLLSIFISVLSTALLVSIVFFALASNPHTANNEQAEDALSFSDTPSDARSLDSSNILSSTYPKGDDLPTNVTTTPYTQDELQNINVYDKCSSAVVNITTQMMSLNWFFEPVVTSGGTGSGAIIDKRGYILTNAHVISDARKIYVTLNNGMQYEATITGVDKDSDLAVIKFTPPDDLVLDVIPFGDSNTLKVGQKVIAIGNPFGFDRTMTCGIVSALGRPIKNENNKIIRNMIQTDTAINPGNSGGPLLDTTGRMIGINTMIYSSSGSSSGIGFAVPSSTAARVVSDLLQYGKVHRGIIDANLVQLNNKIATYAGLSVGRGMLVSQLLKGGNAQAAGLRGGTKAIRYGESVFYLGGDVITKIDGISVFTIADYYSALESKKVGDEVTLTVDRAGSEKTIKMILADPDAE